MKAASDRSKDLRLVRPRFDEAAGRLDETIPYAISLADGLKMLGACGEEGANGHLIRSDTIPNLAIVLTRMLEQIEADTNAMREEHEALTRNASALT
jgi:hypothetical protein